ncbi:hypothetical protein [Streptomyces sp. 6N223]|uniref:hypothetical protein n=1 Tax=Streptomyces sp. 6N223 TaxID=3457412 RepID=UPI003FD49041
MPDLIARALMWLFSLLPAGRGTHRRERPLPTGESPVIPASEPEPTDEAEHSGVILMDDESLLVPWYVVLAESAVWLERRQAELRERDDKRRAQRARRVQALIDGAGIEVHGRVYRWPEALAAAG